MFRRARGFRTCSKRGPELLPRDCSQAKHSGVCSNLLPCLKFSSLFARPRGFCLPVVPLTAVAPLKQLGILLLGEAEDDVPSVVAREAMSARSDRQNCWMPLKGRPDTWSCGNAI